MTNKEINTAVKSELKNAGYNVKDFRVSVKDGLYDVVIRVSVKNPLIRVSQINKLLSHWQHYDLDQASGEILQGGNTYLFVQYDLYALDNIPAEYASKANAILSTFEQHDGREIARNDNGGSLHLLKDGSRYRLIEYNSCNSVRQETIFFHGTQDLAMMLFRFASIGTAAE